MGQLYPKASRVDMGKKPLVVLAHAYRFRTYARSAAEYSWCCKKCRRVNIQDSVHKIQDFSNSTPESFPKEHDFVQVQISWHRSLCIFLNRPRWIKWIGSEAQVITTSASTSTVLSMLRRTVKSSTGHICLYSSSLSLIQ